MSKHRAARPRRVRARYGRMVAAALSLVVTAVALLGGIGLIPLNGGTPETTRNAAADLGQGAGEDTRSTAGHDASRSLPSAPQVTATAKPTDLPAGTGSGRRVVFSESAQRVWLVDASNRVVSTYLVSGSVTDNLQPGKYDVYSKSRWAVGVDDSGVMQYFVRFAHGPNAAIGFHSIPTKNGRALQTVAQLGSPQSHGCIRQKLTDAQRMWDFASVGTNVVVV
ncbi:MAG: L,D-transpeptidase [Nocardioidaceae bacterium]|nr:L,D-transpeptidase [Nocardioidaceae bacterium]